jgi:hypothetical protein
MSATRLTIARDVVEIVAIVAAGVWAFYTFVYENQIKPAQSQADVQVEASLERLGERKGLLAVDSRVTIHNVGIADVWIYGVAETVTGTTVSVRKRDVTTAAPSGGDLLTEPGWSPSAPSAVYGFAFLTKLADANSKGGLNLRPGETVPFDRIFYVASGRFDEMQTHVSVRFSNRADFVPFHFRTNHGIVHIEAAPGADIDGIDENVAALSLWH